MKKILLVIAVVLITSCSMAQITIGFGSGSGSSTNNYNLSLYFDQKDSTMLLVADIQSENSKWSQEPKILFKLMNDSIIELTGQIISDKIITSCGIILFNTVTSFPNQLTTAVFPISRLDILQFQKGIKKMRVGTIPRVGEIEWDTDTLGNKLLDEYYHFIKTRDRSDF